MIILHLAQCTVAVTPLHVATTLPDGSTVYGEPHDTAEYRHTAVNHGYGLDIARMNRTHELTHTMLAHWLGLPASPVFERISAGLTEATDMTALEETAVLAIEAFANHMGVDLVGIARARGAQ